MPYIEMKTTARLTDETCEHLKAAFGEAIALFPGKSERWLMVDLKGDEQIWLGGDNAEDSAILSVDLYGGADADAANKMTAAICEILSRELAIRPDRVYIKYSGFSLWGWNGANF